MDDHQVVAQVMFGIADLTEILEAAKRDDFITEYKIEPTVDSDTVTINISYQLKTPVKMLTINLNL